MLRKLVVMLGLLLVTMSARALEYTDVYYDPAESGWGVFLVQSDTTQFLAFFIYGPDGKPTWYVAILNDDGTGKYTGNLLATTGTYFGNPWQGNDTKIVGTASFAPSDTYHATLTYALTGGPTVSKPVQRQTLTPYVLGGNYSGSMVGSVSGCADTGANIPQFHGRYNLAVTQNGDQSASLTFTFTDTTYAGLVCTLNGALNHLGRLYQMPSAAANCAGGGGVNTGPFVADLESFHPTGQGIEGRWTANFGGGCAGSFRFSAVLRGG